MRMSIIITLVVLLFATVFLGCSSKVNYDDVIGSYKVRYPYGTEELQLNKDGTYTQSVLIDGEAKAIANKGRWEFDKNESKVTLINAMLVDDFFGHLRKNYWKIEPGLSVFTAKSFTGKISLMVNPDQGFAYNKVN